MTATALSPLVYNPFEVGFREDPYPQLRRLRTQDPVHWSPVGKCWVITRYDDATSVLADPGFGIRMDLLLQKPALKAVLSEPFNQIIRPQILSLDPPDHTRIRGVMRDYFSESTVRDLRNRLQQIVNDLIDQVEDRGAMDILADFALPLPLTIISEILGIDQNDRPRLRAWTRDLMRSTDPIPMSPVEIDAANSATAAFQEYFLELAAIRRRWAIG